MMSWSVVSRLTLTAAVVIGFRFTCLPNKRIRFRQTSSFKG
jgi:hypothetical protein